MRQRVVIALALSANPRLVIADEPTTALDVSIQAQIIALLKRLCREHGAAVMLITHDMGVIAETADRVAVMYAGRIVEIGTAEQIFGAARHPYTRALLASMPRLDTARQSLLPAIEGQPPDMQNLPAGCAFRARCAYAEDRCREQLPASLHPPRATSPVSTAGSSRSSPPVARDLARAARR